MRLCESVHRPQAQAQRARLYLGQEADRAKLNSHCCVLWFALTQMLTREQCDGSLWLGEIEMIPSNLLRLVQACCPVMFLSGPSVTCISSG